MNSRDPQQSTPHVLVRGESVLQVEPVLADSAVTVRVLSVPASKQTSRKEAPALYEILSDEVTETAD